MAIDHFQKHSYQKDRVDWNFNVLFGGQPAVAQMAEEYAPIIQVPDMYNPIPTQWLHSTILRVGLTDEFTEDEMLAVATELAPNLQNLTLPEFSFDSWWLSSGNVLLHITPDDEFIKLHQHVITAIQKIIKDERKDNFIAQRFTAHITLAYTKSHHNERALHDRLVDKPIVPANFRATELSLIKQWPTNGHYEWEIIKKLPVGQGV